MSPPASPPHLVRMPASMRLASLWALACLVILSVSLSACTEEPYELFTLEEVRPSRIEPGHRMVILGAGFPVGREVEVLFEGTVHAPLGHARQVQFRTRGRTESPDRVVTTLTESDMANVGRRGTFDGSVEVSLQGSVLEGRSARVIGRLNEVTLDIVTGEPTRRDDAAASLDAERLLGLQLAPDENGEAASESTLEDEDESEDADGSETMPRQTPRGFVLAETQGLARSAGVLPGDRLLRIDHLRVLFPHELRIATDAHVTVLHIEHAGRVREVTINVSGTSSQVVRASFRYDQLAVVILAVALLFGVRRWTPAPVQPANAENTRMVGRFILGLLAVASVLFVGVLPISLGTLVLTASLMRIIVGVFAMRGRRHHETLHEAALLIASSLGLAVSVLVFAAASGSLDTLPSHAATTRIETLVPLYWPLARHPFGPLALLLLIASATGAPHGATHPNTQRERFLRGFDDLALGLFALAFVRVSIADPALANVPARALGLVSLAALMLGLLHVRDAMRAMRGRLRTITVLSVATGGCALLWMQRATSVFEEEAVAEVVLVVLALVVVRIASLRNRATAPAGLARA